VPTRYRVGVAGWSYPDWQGIVYPDSSADQLVYVATYFDAVEVNTTFYRPVAGRMVESWLRRVEPFDDFRFAVKLWRRFTHETEPYGTEEIQQVVPVLETIARAGKLGAVLAQFPYSFKNLPEARERLARLLDVFSRFPLVVEIRHDSFHDVEFVEYLRGRVVGFCNIDQPRISRSIGPTSLATSGIGYIRFHGRNAKEWFNERGDAAARYDYLYSIAELEEWLPRIAEVGRSAAAVYIIANNHYRGQGPANALQVKSMITGEKVDVPPPMMDAFPELRQVAQSPAGQGNLFADATEDSNP